jgi:ATP-binding cassette subfamily B protein/subfamily B ATP-binding cassette protein MsbA
LRSRRIAFIQQTLSAIPIVKAFGSESRNSEIFSTFTEEASWLAKRKALLQQGARAINGSTTAIIIAIVLLVGGQRVLSGAVTLGSLLVFLAYVRSINKSVRGLLQTYVTLKQVEVGVERLIEVLDSDETIEDPPDGRAVPVLSDKSRGHVRFENVTFGYVPDLPIIRDVDLDIQPGESVAIVGKTGSGKTTLVSLIPRFFDPWGGRVTLDGYDLRDLQLSSLRANVALVLQEPFLLPMSIADNIAYGRPDASQAEIMGAAVTANADGFIQKLSDGYETVVAERGVTLSGGQKQLLAIARALLMDASVLILDEPTSALDAETEAQVMEAIHRLVEGRTTFIIAHRLSTIRKAERIIVIEDGSIVEVGTHQELLAKGGRYHYLQQAQMQESSGRLRA